jgi:hypothetical protein
MNSTQQQFKKPAKYISMALLILVLIVYMLNCIKIGNDFETFHDIGKFALSRLNIYAPSPTTGMYVFYLPYFSLLMIPFAFFPVSLAAGAWFLLKCAGFYKTYHFYRKLILQEAPQILLKWWIVLIPFVLMVNPINSDFRLGQVNSFVHFLIIASFFLLKSKKIALSSLCFVISCIKVTPLIFLPYFFIRKQWSILIAIGLWFGVFFGLLFVWFGPVEFASLFQTWLSVSSQQKMGTEALAYFENQSLSGFLARLTLGSKEGSLLLENFQISSFSVPGFKAILYSVSAFLTAAVLLPILFLKRTHKLLDVELALMFVLMLIVSPDTRNAHLFHLLFPVLFFWKTILLKLEYAAAGKIALASVLLGLVMTSRDLVGKEFNTVLRQHSLQLYVLMIFFLCSLYVLWRELLKSRASALPHSTSERITQT